MASPQLKNGYVKIANEIMDALISSKLAGQDFKITFLILRKTYGFNKLEDFISLSQMAKATGMSVIRCSQVVNRLQLMKILTLKENINGIGKKYSFNKDFDQWETLKENINPYKKTKETLKEKRKRPLRKSVSTKDTLTKDTLTKDTRKENIKRKNIYSKDFLTFAKAYPGKINKNYAFRCWQKVKRPAIEKILTAIKNQLQEKKAQKEFEGWVPEWKMASTWINQECWDDEIKKMKGGSKNGNKYREAKAIDEAQGVRGDGTPQPVTGGFSSDTEG